MKIAFIGDQNCIHFNKWITAYAVKTSVIFISFNKKINDDITIHPNVKCYPIIPLVYSISQFNSKKKIVSQINAILNEHKIELIHSSDIIPFAFWCYDLKSFKYIISSHGSDILIGYRYGFNKADGSIKQWLINKILKKKAENAINKAKFVISTSKSQQEIIRGFINDETKLKLIRVGVDMNKFVNVYNSLERNKYQEEFVICCPRLIRRLYNIDIIVNAFNLFSKQFSDLKCRLVLLEYFNDPEYLYEINTLIDNNSLKEKVEILPTLNFENMVQLYHNSDLIVMIPSSDGSPVTAIEAMLAKKPLIIGKIPYDDEIFNSNSVWVCEEFSSESLYAKFSEIYKLTMDQIKLKTNQAFNLASLYADSEKEINKIQELYK